MAALSEIALKRKERDPWTIKVVRRIFLATAIEQLEEGDDEDWQKAIKVHFIGEEGVDIGGLAREFFSLLFKETKVFEGNNFSVNPKLLEGKQYQLLGKSVAAAILNGHPGPRCLNKHVTKYILTGIEPNFADVKIEEIHRADAAAAIKQIEEASPESITDVFTEHLSLLECTGFSLILNYDNKNEAITTLKAYFLLYRVMASINQFMEGLKLNGTLAILQQHSEAAEVFFSEDVIPTAENVQAFFLQSFSSNQQEKAKEEIIMYNFHKFLKKVERGKVTTLWLNPEIEDQISVVLKIGHLLQAFLGCPRIPMNLDSGLILFDHNSVHLPKVNTCAPSILFSSTKQIQDYDTFQERLLNIIVDAYGFGDC